MISDYLMTGAENATTGRELCSLLGIHPRDLTEAIERERREGKPICANTAPPFGYFLAANRSEMKAYCRSLLHRAGELHKTRKACLDTLDSLPE